MAEEVAGVLEVVSDLIQIGTTISGLFTASAEDQKFRSGWTQQSVGEVSSANPGKNVLIVDSDHDASKLVGSQQKVVACPCPNSGAKLAYALYIFDSGPFDLKGDG